MTREALQQIKNDVPSLSLNLFFIVKIASSCAVDIFNMRERDGDYFLRVTSRDYGTCQTISFR